MPKNKLDWGDVVAILFYILGVITIIGGIAMASIWADLTKFVETSGYSINLLGIEGMMAMFILVAMGIVYALIGWLVQERYKIGKTLAFVFGILFLFAFPVGTVIGLVTLYAILGSPVKNEWTRSFE